MSDPPSWHLWIERPEAHRPSVGSTFYDPPEKYAGASPPLYEPDPSDIDRLSISSVSTHPSLADSPTRLIICLDKRKLFLNKLSHGLMAYSVSSDRV